LCIQKQSLFDYQSRLFFNKKETKEPEKTPTPEQPKESTEETKKTESSSSSDSEAELTKEDVKKIKALFAE